MKTYKRDSQNLFKLINTAYNKRIASKIEVADGQLKVMSLERSPYGLLLTGGSRGCREWAREYNTLKNILSMSTTSISKHSLSYD